MTKAPTTAQVIAAEARFVEAGHNARLDTGRHCFLVKSDSRDGVTHEVTIAAQGNELRGTCTCPAGRHAAHGTPVPCRHTAGVMRRLEREGLAKFDGCRWVMAQRLAAVAA